MTRKKSAGKKTKKKGIVRRLVRFIGMAAILFLALSVLMVLVYRFVPVPATPLMLIRAYELHQAGKEEHWRHSWVPIEAMSGDLLLAVVCAEDQKFFSHFGFDLHSIRNSLFRYLHPDQGSGRLRGASTISQQTAKNVFLWPARSWLRKGLEAYFTLLIELFWSKKRILEVYLNSIEMGRGVYGAEAAAHYYFNIGAGKLSRRQAAAIAAVLPNPRSYQIAPPSGYMRERIAWILRQMRLFGQLPIN